MKGFGDRLVARVQKVGSSLVVGLDPHRSRLPLPIYTQLDRDPEGALTIWGCGVIDAVHDTVAALKPQSAFFEVFGPPGLAALANVCAHARSHGLPILLDVKRGDIGSTAEAYAKATLEGPLAADAVTLSPYLGPESLAPFVERARSGKGLFLLVRTSNPGAGPWQEGIAEKVADWIGETNAALGGSMGPIGAVVGATLDGSPWRARMPRAWLLAPGIGAQGAGPSDVAGHGQPNGGGVLPVAARAVLFGSEPREPETWRASVRLRAVALAEAFAPAPL